MWFRSDAVLGVGDRLQQTLGRLPADVTVINPRHPLVGQSLKAERSHCWNGVVWLVVILPDGFPGRLPVADTDLFGESPSWSSSIGTVLSVDGIRRLREIAGGDGSGR